MSVTCSSSFRKVQIITASSCIYEKCQRIGRNKLHIVRVFEELVLQNTVRVYSFHLVSFSLVSFDLVWFGLVSQSLQSTVSPHKHLRRIGIMGRIGSIIIRDRQSMKWRLGRKSNRFYYMLPQSVRPQSLLNRISSLHSLVIRFSLCVRVFIPIFKNSNTQYQIEDK